LGFLVGTTATVAGAQAKPEARRSWTPPPYYDLYPETLPYERGQPVPAGYVVQKTHGTWGIVAGSILVGTFYTYGFLASKNLDGDGLFLALPVVGPPALLLTHKNHCKPRCYGLEQTTLIIDSVGQGLGATFFILGLSLEGAKLVREDLATPPGTEPKVSPTELRLAPIWVGSGYGVGAAGSF
jgi:hypothetical protein